MAANRWGFLLLLSFIRVAMGIQYQSVAAAGPAIRDDLGLDYAGLGAITGSYMMLGALFALPAGFLGARLGDRRMLIGGLGLMVIGGIGIGLAPGFGLALAFRLFSGIGAVVLNIVISKMVMDRFEDATLGLAMGVLLGAWPLGIGAGSIFLPFLVVPLGWRGVMFFAAACCAAFLLLAWWAVPEGPRRAAGRLRFGLSGRVTAAVAAAGFVWLLGNAGYIILLGFAPAFYVERGLSLAEAGAIVSVASFATIPVGPLGGWMGGRMPPMAITALCMAATSIGIYLLPGIAHPALALLLIGAVLGLPSGLIVALPARVLHAEQRAVGMGLFYTIFYAGLGLLPPFAGWVRDVTGAATAPFTVAAAVNISTLLAIGAFLLLARRVRGPRTPAEQP